MLRRAAALIKSQQKYKRGILKIVQNTFPFLILFHSLTTVWGKKCEHKNSELKMEVGSGKKSRRKKDIEYHRRKNIE